MGHDAAEEGIRRIQELFAERNDLEDRLVNVNSKVLVRLKSALTYYRRNVTLSYHVQITSNSI